MTPRPSQRGFTLLELLIGMGLSLLVIGAVLSSFLFLGRSLNRLANQQQLEAESRRTLLYFSQDVRTAQSGSSLSATGATFTLPTSSGTITVTYAYSSSAGTLTRTPSSGGSALILLHNLQSCAFAYYDGNSNAVTGLSNSVSVASIRKVGLTFSAQTGRSVNGTLTPVFQSASPLLSLHNKTWSP